MFWFVSVFVSHKTHLVLRNRTFVLTQCSFLTAKSTTPKKTAGSSKGSSQASSATNGKNGKDGASDLTPAEGKPGKKARSPQPRPKASAGSEKPAEGSSSTKDQRHSRLACSGDAKSVKDTSRVVEGAKKQPESSAPERSQTHINKATEETAFTESTLSTDSPGANQSTEKISEDTRTAADPDQQWVPLVELSTQWFLFHKCHRYNFAPRYNCISAHIIIYTAHNSVYFRSRSAVSLYSFSFYVNLVPW